jgi:tRNA dimethylallyltransferase
MFKNGWINEVKTLYKNDKNIAKLNAFKAIGYNEILNSLLEKREVNIEKIKMETRRYAKRQLTWIRHHYDEKITFNGKNINEIIKKINIFLS